MIFRTEIKPLSCRGSIDLHSRLLLIGSCFSDEIGNRLAASNFDVFINPLGTLYNPASICSELLLSLDPNTCGDDALVTSTSGACLSFHRHSRFYSFSKDEMSKLLRDSWKRCGDYLAHASHLVLTFGSAFAYYHKSLYFPVANCHKQPASMFDLRRLSVQEITEQCGKLFAHIRKINPDLHILLTVSPVRHSGYGLIDDRLSKSRLIVACHELAERCPDITYFPAYEALVDDLRDYRFYADDLAHPSGIAADYIYELLAASFFDAATLAESREWEKLNRMLGHRASSVAETDRIRRQVLERAAKLASNSPYGENIYERFILRHSNGTES